MRQFTQEGNGFILTFGFAVIIIFLSLAALFNSFRDPLIILVSVPMSTAGAMIFIYLGFGGLSLNIYTEVGLVTLMGLVSKHGILIVEVANEARMAGRSKLDAIQYAANIRLRPILMTTAAMVLGRAAAHLRDWRRRGIPHQHGRCHRQRSCDRHAVHPVRGARRLHGALRRESRARWSPRKAKAAVAHQILSRGRFVTNSFAQAFGAPLCGIKPRFLDNPHGAHISAMVRVVDVSVDWVGVRAVGHTVRLLLPASGDTPRHPAFRPNARSAQPAFDPIFPPQRDRNG